MKIELILEEEEIHMLWDAACEWKNDRRCKGYSPHMDRYSPWPNDGDRSFFKRRGKYWMYHFHSFMEAKLFTSFLIQKGYEFLIANDEGAEWDEGRGRWLSWVVFTNYASDGFKEKKND